MIQYQEKLLGFIRQRVDDEDEAKEILAETLATAWEARRNFSGRSAYFTWLGGIARHEIADFYRKKRLKNLLFSHLPWLEDLATQALGPEQELLKKELSDQVKATLGNLDQKYRQVLRLKYDQGLTVAEIAQKLNETVKTVESRLFRARQAFAKAFTADRS